MPGHANIEGLPHELLVLIMSSCHDMTTLYNLLLASPQCSRTFEDIPMAVMTDVIGIGNEHETVLVYPWISAQFQSGDSFIENLREFTEGFAAWSMIRYVDTDIVSVQDCRPVEFQPDTDAATLRKVMSTHRLLSCEALSCLNFYLEKFRGLRVAWIPRKDSADHEITMEVLKHQMEECPPREPFPVKDIGPPTYDEFQILLRALWQQRIVRDVLRCFERGMYDSWPKGEMEKLKAMTMGEIYHFHWLRAWEDGLFNYRPDDDDPNRRKTNDEVILDFVEYHRKVSSTSSRVDYTSAMCALTKSTFIVSDAIEYLVNPAEKIFHTIFRSASIPFQFSLSLDSFYPSGFPLWSLERLSASGLARYEKYGELDPDWPDLSSLDLFLSWTSILGEHDRGQLPDVAQRFLESWDKAG